MEHPAYSHAFARYSIGFARRGSWQRSADGIGWITHVDQGRYGHVAQKATWLYAVSDTLPSLDWGEATGSALVSWCGNRVKSGEVRPRVGKAAASATPEAFAHVLLSIADGTAVPGRQQLTLAI